MDNNNGNYEDVCMMCHRNESKAGRMIKLPGNLCVCEDCMNRSYDLLKNMGLDKMFESIPGWTVPSDMPKQTGESQDSGEVSKDPQMQAETPVSEEKKEDDEPQDASIKFEKYLRGFPNISFLNLADLAGGGMAQRSRVVNRNIRANINNLLIYLSVLTPIIKFRMSMSVCSYVPASGSGGCAHTARQADLSLPDMLLRRSCRPLSNKRVSCLCYDMVSGCPPGRHNSTYALPHTCD